MAIRRRGVKVIGVDISPKVIARAIQRGAIDEGGTDPQVVSAADLVILAAPLNRLQQVTRELAKHLRLGCLVTDVGSVKGQMLADIEGSLLGSVRFVGGHPMFGTSGQGIEAADPDLVVGAPFVITPTSDSDAGAVSELTRWATDLGMKPLLLSPQEHDSRMAMLSHLPYLIACALTDAAADAKAAGPAFQEMTRVAMSPPELWGAILRENREAIESAVERFQNKLAQLALLQDGEQTSTLVRIQAKRMAMFPKAKR